MGRIQRLPDHIANKIAAGEVVQRPSSVIKELVENSLDAGATEIAVTIRNAGKSLIFIADNGSGMSQEDARIAFERHATSKIRDQEDLDRILTLGFRGEALAAIASVAQVELKTRQPEEELGTLVRVENGQILEVTKTACDVGTSIAVKNLFFSVPARRKFLKSNATEFKHMAETMQAFALSYPNISFTLSDNDSLVMRVEGGTIEERIAQIYSNEMLNALLPFEAEAEGIAITGFVGRPNFARKSKTDQYLFMNGRAITSKLLSHAVWTGYEHLLDKQSYPPYILFLQLDPEKVDVNVHPAKSEVKFDDEQLIYGLIQEGTRRTLGAHNLTPSMILPDTARQDETGEGVIAALRYALPQFDRPERFQREREEERREPGGRSPYDRGGSDRDFTPPRSRDERNGSVNGDLFRQLFIDPYSGESTAPGIEAAQNRVEPEELFTIGVASGASTDAGDGISIPQQVRSPREGESEHVGLWQIHDKYIVSQIRSGIMIVDQHVAHERILYEQALRTMETAMPVAQQLLFPLEMKLPPAEFALAQELKDGLASLGFDVAFGPNEIIILHGVPQDVRSGEEGAILKELLDQYAEYQQMGKTDRREMLAASFACRASIKAGDPLSEVEMLSLIEQLFSTTMPYVCPHGRPIVIRIDLAELDRRFGRTS